MMVTTDFGQEVEIMWILCKEKMAKTALMHSNRQNILLLQMEQSRIKQVKWDKHYSNAHIK